MSDNTINSPRGQFDPGWNDPPKMQYQPTSQTGKTKLNLNKRIAFPLHGGTQVSKPTAIVQPSLSTLPLMAVPSQPPIAVVPPMPLNISPQLQKVPTLETTTTLSTDENLTDNFRETTQKSEETRLYCLNTFEGFIAQIQESINVKSNEVQRRIHLMNQMWLSGTLTSSVHKKLHNIAKALESNNFNDAIENHRALVVDHSNVCTAWGSALRQIILSIQDSSQQQPESSLLVNNILIPTITVFDNNSTGTTNASESQTGPIQHL